MITVLSISILVGMPLAIFYAIFIRNACLTEIRQTISNVSGFDFDISETSCDILAKDDAISIYVTKSGQNRKTEIFKYDPIWYRPLPKITVLDDKHILISVPFVSSIYFRKYEFNDASIAYDIGHVTDSDKPASFGVETK